MIEISSNGYSQQFVSDNRFVSDDPTKLPYCSKFKHWSVLSTSYL